MQLPSPQLIEALDMSPDLKEPLKEHIQNLTENQRAHVPATVQEILMGPTPKVPIIEPPLVWKEKLCTTTKLSLKSNFRSNIPKILFLNRYHLAWSNKFVRFSFFLYHSINV